MGLNSRRGEPSFGLCRQRHAYRERQPTHRSFAIYFFFDLTKWLSVKLLYFSIKVEGENLNIFDESMECDLKNKKRLCLKTN